MIQSKGVIFVFGCTVHLVIANSCFFITDQDIVCKILQKIYFLYKKNMIQIVHDGLKSNSFL